MAPPAPSASSAPPGSTASTAPPGPALVVVPMKLTIAMLKGTLEIRKDGTAVADGKPFASISGPSLLDRDGKTLITVLADGTMRLDGPSARFDAADSAVIDSGAKMTVRDDGVVQMFTPAGKADSMSGKMKFQGFKPAARRAATVFVLGFFLLQDRAAGATPAGPTGN
jgi:hypothetical protein